MGPTLSVVTHSISWKREMFNYLGFTECPCLYIVSGIDHKIVLALSYFIMVRAWYRLSIIYML